MDDTPKVKDRVGIALETAVFICGAVVMIYEINGSRILAPFIGTSTYIWTSLIGVILASLSLGYWYGGKIADKRPRVSILASLIFLAGGLVSVTILTKEVVLGAVAGLPAGLEVKAFLSSLFLFAPASVVLGCVLPYASKLRLSSLADSGKTVGRLYAVSTVGSILGTFAAGFFLIPFVGSTRTLHIIAGALFITSLFLAPFALDRVKVLAITIFLTGVAFNEIVAVVQWRHNGFQAIDTQYARLSLFQTVHPSTGREIQALTNDPYFTQSAMFLDSDELVFDYNKFFHLVRHFDPNFKHSLMIGGAGYSFPRDYLKVYPTATIDVVEIDPTMTDLARKHFRLIDDQRLNIFHEDARVFINRAPDRQYDAIMMDAFGTLFSIPHHLTTFEAAQHLHRMLKDDGVLMINTGAALTGPGSRFLQAELNTLKLVFEDVRIFKVKGEYRDDELQNVMVVASKAAIPAALSADPQIAAMLSHEYTMPTSEIAPLTDDLAPVEYYNSFALNTHSRARGQ
jgi:spermidine synthase